MKNRYNRHDEDALKSPKEECDEINYQLVSGDDIRGLTVGDDGNMETLETLSAKKKHFEAFVMTGDRMINLAKTPANNEFKSKYHKTLEPIPLLEDESASMPSSPPPITSPENEYQFLNDSNGDKESGDGNVSEQMDQSGSDSNVVKLRQQPQRNRSAVR